MAANLYVTMEKERKRPKPTQKVSTKKVGKEKKNYERLLILPKYITVSLFKITVDS